MARSVTEPLGLGPSPELGMGDKVHAWWADLPDWQSYCLHPDPRSQLRRARALLDLLAFRVCSHPSPGPRLQPQLLSWVPQRWLSSTEHL